MQSLKTPPTSTQPSDTGVLAKRSLIWSLIGLVMLLVITGVSIWTLREVAESDFWVDHTREVINTNEQLLSDVKDAESAERGYIITGDGGYLDPYRSAFGDSQHSIQKLLELTKDNPSQQERLTDLHALIAKRMDVFNTALQQRKTSGFTAAEAVVVAGQGRTVMKQIRESSSRIADEEDRLLQTRTRTRQVRLRNGFIATLFAAVVALIALILAPIDVRWAVRQQRIAEQEKRQSEATAEALFEAAAQAILAVNQQGRIMMVNPATQKMLGYSEHELIGQSVELLVPENLRGGHIGHRSGYFHNPQNRPMGFGLDLQARKKDGTVFDVEISLSYIRSEKETLAVAFMSDISKRKADEQAIRRQGEDLRLLTGRLMTAQDDERRRIARDLHDDLSQKLAYLAMDIGKLVSKATSHELLDSLRGLQRRAGDAAETVRHISHQLHPSILDDIGLEAALEQYCEEFEERSGIRTHFLASDVPESIPKEISRSLYHIFQESLRNVSKHSNAPEVFVTLGMLDGALRLSVRDEGVGLAGDSSSSAGIGITGMKERAHLINGKVSIESRAGEGTEVNVTVPLSNAG
ncbi:MAG: CHASE3 domain-containing protein [Acidobacteriaceae bacterium]|nr:CHASE3 domain-containing protein [Acidobacteriaceae bacterium]